MYHVTLPSACLSSLHAVPLLPSAADSGLYTLCTAVHAMFEAEHISTQLDKPNVIFAKNCPAKSI